MTEFELALADALRDEAEEIAMSTDQQHGTEELHARLDQSDQHRRRWYVAGAVAAALVVAVLVIAFAVRPSGDSSGGEIATDPSPSASAATSAVPSAVPFTAPLLLPPVSLELPAWTQDADHDADQTGVANWLQDRGCAGLDGADPCAEDKDLKLRLLSVRYVYPTDADLPIVQEPTYAAYVSHLDELAALGTIATSDRSTPDVGGRPATVMSLTVLTDAAGAVACTDGVQPAVDCMPLIAGRAARIAVVDQGSANPPTVIYLSLNGDAPDRAERYAEFDSMLSTVTFG